MRIAINGMGRIGRLLFRRLVHHETIELVAVNDIMDTGNLVYLLKYDSVYGTFPGDIRHEAGELVVNNKTIAAFSTDHPSRLPWKKLGIDVVLECSGRFTSRQAAETHVAAGASKVLLSTTGTADIPLMIYGFNQHALTPETAIISPGGCMTNCSTHVLNILNALGITSAHLNMLHSYTSRQELVDAPHKQWRRGRAAGESIVPVEIDLCQSLERLFPVLQHKMAAVSTRVPVANGALADFTIQLHQETSAEAINRLFRTAAQNEYRGIIEYSEDPLVSIDIKGNTHSCIIDGTLTSVVGNHLKLFAWFDNEYGFTSRMMDWLQLWKDIYSPFRQQGQ
jgi:glyceraldehyde 3-phosphate dehydrogenase